MFGDVAKTLLRMMGQTGDVPGALLAANIPGAVERLKQGVSREPAQAQAPRSGGGDDAEPAVALKHRALPLIELLERAAKRGDDVLARAHNQVVATNDPTAHAEIGAISAACAVLNSFQLEDCDLYASCEPCPMCLGAIYWARPRAVFYAATRHDAAAAGFDDAFVYEQIAIAPQERSLPMRFVDHPDAHAPFAAWAVKPDKTEY